MTATRSRRADAERNSEAIIQAGMELLSADPTASVGDIAEAAGVGRVTLYGHFPSREALVEAVVAHAIAATEQSLDNPELDRLPAPAAMTALIGSSWEILDRHTRLFVAAERVMSREKLREHHELPLKRVERIIARGREEGAFRTDLPLPWLVSTVFSVLHNAAQEIEAGRLERPEADQVLTATLLAVLRTP